MSFLNKLSTYGKKNTHCYLGEMSIIVRSTVPVEDSQ